MLRFSRFMAAVLLAVAAVPPARAEREPYLALRTGFKCSQCHVNRSGGGGRSDFGAIYAQTMLPARTGTVRSRALNDFISVGFDVRAVASGTFRQATPQTGIELNLANVFVEARLIDQALTLYIDEVLGPGRAVAREAFGLVRWTPGNGYAKVGKFLLPYGLRLQDDAEYIRERTGFTYATPDQGVELGFEPGPLSFMVSVTNGSQGASENDNGKQVTSTAAFVFPHLRLGASASRNHGTAGSRRDVFGGFGGIRAGRLTLMGEVDRIRDRLSNGTVVEQDLAFIEGDLLATKGVNAKVTYGFHDRNRSVREDHRYRMRFGLEVFPVQFIRLAAFYTLLEDIPQALNQHDRASLELHVHF